MHTHITTRSTRSWTSSASTSWSSRSRSRPLYNVEYNNNAYNYILITCSLYLIYYIEAGAGAGHYITLTIIIDL